MSNILVAGAGKIGTVVAHLLAAKENEIYLADIHLDFAKNLLAQWSKPNLHFIELNIDDHKAAQEFIRKNKIDSIVSCLPYYLNISIAELAARLNLIYFDLTEDTKTAKTIDQLAKKNSELTFVPQCGLAPGFVNIVAADLMKRLDSVETVKIRCGALPQTTSHALQYANTWSIDGLINEYANPCLALMHGKPIELEPLADLESIQIDGQSYEAFNTSGGISSMPETYEGKIQTLNYKTIRYPGHCDKMRFLMFDLKLADDRETLKRILLNSVPSTTEDVVIVYASAHGQKNNQLFREPYVKKFYPVDLLGLRCTAIQATTASSACAVIDLVLTNSKQYKGRVRQESFRLCDILDNIYGQWMKRGTIDA